MQKMPTIDRTALLDSIDTAFPGNAEEYKRMANLLFVRKTDNIRASKPKVDPADPVTGKAAYLWRMVVFTISPKRQHQCMPCTADFDITDANGKWTNDHARAVAQSLKGLEDHIVNMVPKCQWYGIRRWGRIFG